MFSVFVFEYDVSCGFSYMVFIMLRYVSMELSHIEGQEGGSEEILFVQGKEQQLRFVGAAVKSYPTPKIRETQVRW